MKTVTKEQILQRLVYENPWWQKPHQINDTHLKWTPRPYLDLFYPLASNRKVRRAVVLMGPRRVGKTVMIHHAIQELINNGIDPKNIFYVSVDHPIYNGLGLEQLLDYHCEATGVDCKINEIHVFFDEIQYLRDWEVHLKSIVDSYENIQCVVSGSAAAALRLKSYESGAGRFTDFLLPPLTFHEYLFLLGDQNLVSIDENESLINFRAADIEMLNSSFLNYMNFGGYPEVVFSKEIQSDPSRYIKSDIIDKVLLRDLPSLYGIQDIQELNYLFTTLAFNTANEVSLEELSRGSGVAKNTIKRYIEYLEAAFLVRVVHRVDNNARHFKRANYFKVYLTNPSIRSALFSPIDYDDQMIGSMVETAIFAQWFHSEFTKLHYARWQKGEVDIVKLDEKNKVRWAVEAKWSDRYFDHPDELKQLISFCHVNNLKQALITTRTFYGIKEYQNVSLRFTQASLYAFMLGYNIIKGKASRLKVSLEDEVSLS